MENKAQVFGCLTGKQDGTEDPSFVFSCQLSPLLVLTTAPAEFHSSDV